jgi:hypothetical protein
MSIEIAIAEGIVRLADKLGAWAGLSKAKKEQRFKELIAPAFATLEIIHRDYLQMFRTAHDQNRAGTSIKEIRNSLATQRIAEEARRKGLLAQVMVLSGEGVPDDVHEFFATVRQYFVYTPLWEGTASAALEYILKEAEALELNGEGARLYVKLDEYIDSSMHRMRGAWADVAKAYGHAKLNAYK